MNPHDPLLHEIPASIEEMSPQESPSFSEGMEVVIHVEPQAHAIYTEDEIYRQLQQCLDGFFVTYCATISVEKRANILLKYSKSYATKAKLHDTVISKVLKEYMTPIESVEEEIHERAKKDMHKKLSSNMYTPHMVRERNRRIQYLVHDLQKSKDSLKEYNELSMKLISSLQCDCHDFIRGHKANDNISAGLIKMTEKGEERIRTHNDNHNKKKKIGKFHNLPK